MAKSEFRVRMDGLAASACRAVQIDLDEIDSITPEAAALLLFRGAPWHAFPEKISLRANGKARQAVLRAYARRRARSQTA